MIEIINFDDGEDMKMRISDIDYHPVRSILVPEFYIYVLCDKIKFILLLLIK